MSFLCPIPFVGFLFTVFFAAFFSWKEMFQVLAIDATTALLGSARGILTAMEIIPPSFMIVGIALYYCAFPLTAVLLRCVGLWMDRRLKLRERVGKITT